MKLCVVVVTVNKSVCVRTLHTLLKLNMFASVNQMYLEIQYVNNDPFTISEVLNKKIKLTDRLIFVDYGVGIDDTSIKTMGMSVQNNDCIIYPCVTEGIDWKLFEKNMNKEELSQAGMSFDTDVGTKISDGFYKVISSVPKVISMDSKKIYKKLKKFPVRRDEWISKMLSSDVKICAYSKAKCTVSYNHECYGNILQTAGVKVK